MNQIFVGLGSNIDRNKNIKAGLTALETRFGKLEISGIYESEAYGFEGDNFYNLVTGFLSELSLADLAFELKQIEMDYGRRREAERFKSRTLDLDLLLYGDLILHNEEYDLPRKDIEEYSFVLCPLAEIAGNRIHPENGQTYQMMWDKFDKGQHKIWKVTI